MPKRFSRGWLIACIIACINAHPARQQKRDGSYSPRNFGNLPADYGFEDLSVETFDGRLDGAVNDESSSDDAPSTTARNKYVRLPLVLEPDAEMLPAHYTGVKSPGVDHMEIEFLDSSVLSSNRFNSLSDGAKYKDRTNSAGRSRLDFAQSLKGAVVKQNLKGDYDESAGKMKSQQEVAKYLRGRNDAAGSHKSVNSESKLHRGEDDTAAGYRRAYHKNESEKNADYYDNEHEGGRYRKHGHYDEKHTATKGNFRKDDRGNSSFAQAQAEKTGNFGLDHTAEKSTARASKVRR